MKKYLLILALLCIPQFAGATIVAKNAWKLQTAATSTGFLALTATNGTAGSTTPGRLLVATITAGENVAGLSTNANHRIFDDVQGATGWTKLAGGDGVVSNGDAGISLWYKIAPPGLSKINCVGGTTVAFVTCYVEEFSGNFGNGGALVATTTSATIAVHTVSSATVSTGTITATSTNSLVIAAHINAGSLAGQTQALNAAGTNPTTPAFASINTTFSRELDCATWWCGGMVYNVLTAAVTNVKHVWTLNLAQTPDATVIAVFTEQPTDFGSFFAF